MPTILKLRDIHLPDAVSWWPLAPTWWVLVAVLLVAVLLVAITLLIYLWRCGLPRQWKIKRAGVDELAAIKRRYSANKNEQKLIAELSIFLRRYSISLYGRKYVAALTAQEWLQFLDSPITPEKSFSQGVGEVLVSAPYQAQPPECDGEALLNLADKWLIAVSENINLGDKSQC